MITNREAAIVFNSSFVNASQYTVDKDCQAPNTFTNFFSVFLIKSFSLIYYNSKIFLSFTKLIILYISSFVYLLHVIFYIYSLPIIYTFVCCFSFPVMYFRSYVGIVQLHYACM